MVIKLLQVLLATNGFLFSLHVTAVFGLAAVSSYSTITRNSNGYPSSMDNTINTKVHKFYVLRHGQTDANAGGVIQGSADFSRLTELGRQQAVEAGMALSNTLGHQNQRIDSIYVSPLARATETLSLVRKGAQHHNSNLQLLPFTETVWHELRELDLYDWEGRNKDDLQTNDAIAWNAWKDAKSYDFVVSGRKPLVEVWDRAANVWDQLRQAQQQQQQSSVGSSGATLLVCHGTLGQALLNTALGRNDARYFRDIDFPNCGLVEIEWSVDSPTASSWQWHHPSTEEGKRKWNLYEWEQFQQQQQSLQTASYADSLRERNLSLVA